MKISEALAKKINKICIEKNMSINKFANTCCLTQSTVQHLVDGSSKNPKTLTIVRICDGLGMSISEFFSDEVFDNLDREDSEDRRN